MAVSDPIIGIDLGGTHFQVGVVDRSGSIQGRTRGKTLSEEGMESVLDRLADAVREAMADAKIDRALGVGLAAPGAVDHLRGVVVNAPNLKWFEEPIAQRFTDRVGMPVVLENDVNAALWGEHTMGAARNATDVLGAWLGTGVGGALILNGELYHGALLTAGELGHVIVRPDREPPAWELEQVSSRSAVVEQLCADIRSGKNAVLAKTNSGVPKELSLADVRAAFDAGDGPTVEVLHEAASAIGAAVGSVVTLLSLKVVVLGGGLAESMGPGFVSLVTSEINRHAWPAVCQGTDVRLTTLEDNAGLLGAAQLARRAISEG